MEEKDYIPHMVSIGLIIFGTCLILSFFETKIKLETKSKENLMAIEKGLIQKVVIINKFNHEVIWTREDAKSDSEIIE